MLTKDLVGEQFVKLRSYIGICKIQVKICLFESCSLPIEAEC